MWLWKGTPRVLVLGLFSIMTVVDTQNSHVTKWLQVNRNTISTLSPFMSWLWIYCTIILQNRAVGRRWVKGNGSPISIIILNLWLSQISLIEKWDWGNTVEIAVQVMLRAGILKSMYTELRTSAFSQRHALYSGLFHLYFFQTNSSGFICLLHLTCPVSKEWAFLLDVGR